MHWYQVVPDCCGEKRTNLEDKALNQSTFQTSHVNFVKDRKNLIPIPWNFLDKAFGSSLETKTETLRRTTGPSCWKNPVEVDQHLIIVSPPVADQENTEGSTGDHLQDVARQNVVWVTLFSRLATKMSSRKCMDGLFLVARVSSGSSRRYYSSIKAEFSEGVKLFLSSVYVSLVIFKVDQQQRHKQNRWCLYLCVCFLSLSLHEFLCHSTSSFRKGDRLGINKKKRIVILSSSSNSPFTPSRAWSLSLSPTPAPSTSLILKSPSPKNKILLTPLHLLISTI